MYRPFPDSSCSSGIQDLFLHKKNIEILLKHKMVIYTSKAIVIRIIDKRIVTAGVANIPKFNKDIGLTRLSTNLSFRNIDRVRIKVLGIDASVVIHSFNKQGISTIGTHPPSNEFLMRSFCGL